MNRICQQEDLKGIDSGKPSRQAPSCVLAMQMVLGALNDSRLFPQISVFSSTNARLLRPHRICVCLRLISIWSAHAMRVIKSSRLYRTSTDASQNQRLDGCFPMPIEFSSLPCPGLKPRFPSSSKSSLYCPPSTSGSRKSMSSSPAPSCSS